MGIHRIKILGFTLLLGGLALCSTGFSLLLQPTQYQASVIIKVERMTDIGENGQNASYDPYFIQTEYEVIQDRVVLGKVVESLNLNVEWGKKRGNHSPLKTNEAIELLKRQMKLEPVRNTALIKISFFSKDPTEAARVANAIAKAYSDYRVEQLKQMIRGGILALTEAFQTQEEEIRTMREKLEQLGKQLHLPNPEPDQESLKLNYLPYFQAQQELQKKTDFHKLLKAKIESEKLNFQIPKTSMVDIIIRAEPPKSPLSLNRPLGAALLAIGLFPTIGGFLLLKSSRH